MIAQRVVKAISMNIGSTEHRAIDSLLHQTFTERYLHQPKCWVLSLCWIGLRKPTETAVSSGYHQAVEERVQCSLRLRVRKAIGVSLVRGCPRGCTGSGCQVSAPTSVISVSLPLGLHVHGPFYSVWLREY